MQWVSRSVCQERKTGEVQRLAGKPLILPQDSATFGKHRENCLTLTNIRITLLYILSN